MLRDGIGERGKLSLWFAYYNIIQWWDFVGDNERRTGALSVAPPVVLLIVFRIQTIGVEPDSRKIATATYLRTWWTAIM